MSHGPLIAFASALALVVAATAQAEPATKKGARLTWVRGVEAERCVGRIGLEEDVKARLGYDPFALASALAIEGTVVSAPPGFRAELVVRDREGNILGSRRLASREPDCRSLGEAVAVAITVAIDPDAPAARPAQVDDLAAVAEPPPKAPSPPPPKEATAPRGSRGRATLSGGAAVGLLPGVTPSGSLVAMAALGGGFELGAGAHFWPEARREGFGFGLATASIDACLAPFRAARAIRWCAAGHVGLLSVFVHAAELSPVDVGMFPWAAGETGPALAIPLVAALRLDLGVSAVVPILRRQAFVRGRPEAVWEQDAIGARGEVGIGASF